MTSTVRSSDGRVIVPEKLRRRRARVLQDRGRRRLHRVVAFFALAAVLGGGWALLRSPLLAVDEVVLSGSSHVDRAQIAQVSSIAKGLPMMDVSPGRAVRQIETLPWVARAHVSRQWPNTVKVTVQERKPVAQLAAGSSFALVDREGRVLQDGVPRSEALPLITGHRAVGVGERMRASDSLLATAAAMPRRVGDHVEGIGLTRDGTVALRMQGDGTVTLGRSEEFAAKFASVQTVLDHLGSLRAGCTLDVSVPMSPTLTPEYGCA